jgi:hypothetical protein
MARQRPETERFVCSHILNITVEIYVGSFFGVFSCLPRPSQNLKKLTTYPNAGDRKEDPALSMGRLYLL